MKIIHVIGDASTSGGPSHVLALSQGQRKLGHEIEVISPHGTLAKYLQSEGFVWHRVEMSSPFDRKAVHLIRLIIQNSKPDVVHCHGLRGGWLGRLATRKIPGQKTIYSEHLWTKEYHLPSRIWEQFQLRGLRYLDHYTARTIAVSNAVKRFLVFEKISKPENITVVYNGIDWGKWDQLLYERPNGLPTIFGSVGSLHERKNYLGLLDAIALLKKKYPKAPTFQCQIIGEGPQRKELREKIENLGLTGEVMLRGRVDDVQPVLRHFGFYVQPSKDEAFGVALVEAMALGLPPIVTNVGGMVEVVEHEKSGLIVGRKTSDIADGIYKLLSNKKLRLEMGKEAKKRVKVKFTMDRMAEETIKVYREVLTRKH